MIYVLYLAAVGYILSPYLKDIALYLFVKFRFKETEQDLNMEIDLDKLEVY